MGLAVIEVRDVGRRLAAPTDLDRLLERIEEPVAERVALMAVVEAIELAGRARELGELLGRCEAAGWIVEAGREADGPVAHRIPERALHAVDGLGVGGDIVPTPGIDAELAVPDERADIDADRSVIAGEVVGDRAPVIVDVGPAVETCVEVDERLEVLAPAERREPVAVDTDDLGRDALSDLRLVAWLGQDDEAAMAVEIDEAGGDDAPRGVDRGCGVLWEWSVRRQLAHPVALDHDRARSRRRSRTVHDRAAGDEDVDAVTHQVNIPARRGRDGASDVAAGVTSDLMR